jgi:hypothetical protein
MNQLPQAIIGFWGNSALSSIPLYYEYAPIDIPTPLAVFAPSGFSREYQNEHMMIDTYQYDFVVLSEQAEDVYLKGFQAVTLFNGFEYIGLIQVTPMPEAMATPTKADPGFKTQWEYKFRLEFMLQPII